jgi:hypothetical protein
VIALQAVRLPLREYEGRRGGGGLALSGQARIPVELETT